MKEWLNHWRHVFKLDPDRELDEHTLDRICTSDTDAILIGGSSGITYDNVVELLSRVRRYSVPCALEVSSLEAVVPGFDVYLIPSVLNTSDADWLIGYHQEAVKQYGSQLPWSQVATEGYVILNPNCTAAKVTQAKTALTPADVKAYAQIAERLFSLPILYIEYSGTFGDMELLRAASGALKRTRLFYGGGIDSKQKAQEAAQWADTIVVGNIIYEDIEQALSTLEAFA